VVAWKRPPTWTFTDILFFVLAAGQLNCMIARKLLQHQFITYNGTDVRIARYLLLMIARKVL
jgi:hypothetical protein